MDKHDGELSESDSCAESGSEEFFHDSVDGRKEGAEFSSGQGDGAGSKKHPQADLVLDLRNVPPIACASKSDDENSEKLSAVIEQPEEHLGTDTTSEESEGNNGNLDKVLRERIRRLQEVIIDLRRELRREIKLWREERDEYQLLRERSDILALEEATAAARAAAEAYAAESPLSNEIGDVVDLNPVQSLSELTILEYEKKLAKYHDALALAQAEKRYNMHRQSIANTYQQRLLEVERLCNEEFEKMKENADNLRPLREMASQWCIKAGDEAHGEAIDDSDSVVGLLGNREKSVPTAGNDNTDKTGKVDGEVNVVPEVVAARFTYAESLSYGIYGRHAKVSQSYTDRQQFFAA